MFNIGSSAVDDLQAFMKNANNPLAGSRALSSVMAKYGTTQALAQQAAPAMGANPIQLQKMMHQAAGIPMDKAPAIDPNSPPPPPPAPAGVDDSQMAKSPGYARGGYVRGYADGGSVGGEMSPEDWQDYAAQLDAAAAGRHGGRGGADDIDRNTPTWQGDGDGHGRYVRVGDIQWGPGGLGAPDSAASVAAPDALQKGGTDTTPDDGYGGIRLPRLASNLDAIGEQAQTGLASIPPRGQIAADSDTGGLSEHAAELPSEAWRNRSNFEKYLPLVAAGLGVLGSKEPGLRSLGGALEGSKLYSIMKSQTMKGGLEDIQARDYASQAELRKAQMNLAQQQIDDYKRLGPALQAGLGGGAGSIFNNDAGGVPQQQQPGQQLQTNAPPQSAPSAQPPAGPGGPVQVASADPQTMTDASGMAMGGSQATQKIDPRISPIPQDQHIPPGKTVLGGVDKNGVISAQGQPLYNLPNMMRLGVMMAASKVPQYAELGRKFIDMSENALNRGYTYSTNNSVITLPGMKDVRLDKVFADAGIDFTKDANGNRHINLGQSLKLQADLYKSQREQDQVQNREIAVQDAKVEPFTYTPPGSNQKITTLMTAGEAKRRGAQQAARDLGPAPGLNAPGAAPPGAPGGAPGGAVPAPTAAPADVSGPGAGLMPEEQQRVANDPALRSSMPPRPPMLNPNKPNPLVLGAPNARNSAIAGNTALTPQGEINAKALEVEQKKVVDAGDVAQSGQADTKLARNMLEGFHTNEFARLAKDLGAHALALGMDPAWVNKTFGDIEKGETLDKAMFRISSGAVRAMGAREPGSVIALFNSRYPGLDYRTATNRLLLNIIDAQQQRDQDKVSALAHYQSVIAPRGGDGTPAGFNTWFNQNYKASDYVDRAYERSGIDSKTFEPRATNHKDGSIAPINGVNYVAHDGRYMREYGQY